MTAHATPAAPSPTPRDQRGHAAVPPWRDVRNLAWLFQFAVVLGAIALVAWLWGNYQDRSAASNIPSSFSFLNQPADFPISGSDFRRTQPVRAAIVEGLFNTLRLVVAGVILATVVGTLVGIARLSKNFLVNKAAQVYVEFIRNIPLFALLVLMYSAVVLRVLPDPRPGRGGSWEWGPVAVLNTRGIGVLWFEGGNLRFVLVVAVFAVVGAVTARLRRRRSDATGAPARTGLWGGVAGLAAAAAVWALLGLGISAPELSGLRTTGGIVMTPPYAAALAALVIYTSSHIAEIVRGSILAVPRGQGEAANAVALSSFQRMWFVVLPQALRVGVPAIGNQYLNLAKNSSLAAAIAFPELTQIVGLSVANRSPAVPAFALLLLIYLVISLVLSALVNLANRRLAIVER